jgi:IS30 family transposase
MMRLDRFAIMLILTFVFTGVMAVKKLPTEKVKTITFDNGKEFAGFK